MPVGESIDVCLPCPISKSQLSQASPISMPPRIAALYHPLRGENRQRASGLAQACLEPSPVDKLMALLQECEMPFLDGM
jgi:hypothetical protein